MNETRTAVESPELVNDGPASGNLIEETPNTLLSEEHPYAEIRLL
jgi:hypothetical protein